MSAAPPRPLRADAVRSAERIVRAAREVYTTSGPDASLEEIARRAGVGTRTLYRRFPTKADLALAALEEILAEEIAPAVETALGDPDGLAGLTSVIDAAVTMAGRERNLLAAVQSAGALTPEIYVPFNDTLARLMQRGQDEGRVRPDLHPDDLPRIMVMLISALITTEPGSNGWRRYLALMTDAISTGDRRPLTIEVPAVVPRLL